MADDLDPMDDLFDDKPVKKARAAGKFMFKPKLHPQKKAAVKISVTSTQAIQTERSSDVLPDLNEKVNSHDGTSVEENADAFVVSEPIGDILLPVNTDASALFASKTENIEGRLGTQVLSSSTIRCKADVTKDPSPPEDLAVSSTDVHKDKDNRHGTEEMDVMDSISMTEFATESGQGTNFQPEIKTCEESGSTLTSPLQQDSAEKDLSSTSQLDDVIDLLSLGLTHALPTESTSEIHLSEEPMNHLEVHQLDSCTHMEGLPEMPAKLASRRAKTRNSKNNATPEQQKASTSSKENESGRSLRSKNGKMNICDLVDELIAVGDFSGEHPSGSAIDGENINSEQPEVEDESQKKNLKRKSKKTEKDKEKPPRKSKKAKEAPEQETHAKQKKFSHSTQRRRVNKDLLNIPEEEFDPTEVPFKDLILLAEHRERQMKTDNAAAGTQETQQRAANTTGLYNDEANNFRADEDGEVETPTSQDTTEYFNYHSGMHRIPRVKWSKQDTELFYGAVKQFGTDFSMIAQLFPGRSREQIRNKYKKEERQQPLMLREALTTRSKDHSYFKKVIDDLKQLRAKEVKEEDLEDLSNQDETSNPDDDQAKHEYVEEEANVDIANDSTEARSSPVKGEEEQQEEEVEEDVEEEDEDDPWNQYKTGI